MVLRDGEFARRNELHEKHLELRAAAMRLAWPIDDLIAADGHLLVAQFSASVRALDDEAERQMLLETFFTREGPGVVTADDVVRHFAPALHAAARRVAAMRDAAGWVNPGADSASFVAALRDAGRAVAFSCGLELLAPFQLDLQSPTLRRQQLEASQRHLSEQRAAGRVEHMQHAIAMLQQFRSLHQTAPELSAGQWLEQLAPADRGDALHTLLLASANEAPPQALYVVAGPHVVRIDPASLVPAVLATPAALGPLRSIRAVTVESQSRLLVGAQRGVLLLDPDCPSEAIGYPCAELSSPLGFNSALIAGSTLYASHSEAGLVAWKLNEPAAPPATIPLPAVSQDDFAAGFRGVRTLATTSIRPASVAAGPRNLILLPDHRLLFSLGTSLYALDSGGQLDHIPLPSSDPIVAMILGDHGRLNVVHEGGVVQVLATPGLESVTVRQRAGRVCAATALPWLGGIRLLLASEDGPVLCMGSDDTLVSQYLSSHRGLRSLAACPMLIAGLSADRRAVVLWHPASPQAPCADLAVASVTGHRVADFVFM